MKNQDKLADQAWAELSRQLDEVMPVRKRRRWRWLWLTLLLLAGTAGAYMGYQQYTSGHSQPKQETIGPVATAKQSPDAQSDHSTPVEKQTENQVGTNKSNNMHSTPFVAASDLQSLDWGLSTSLYKRSTPPPSTDPNPSFGQSPQEHKQPNLQNQSPGAPLTQLGQAMVVLDAQPQEIPVEPIAPAPVIVTQKPKASGLKFITSAYGGWRDAPRPDLFGLSAGIELQPPSINWGLRLEAGYQATYWKPFDIAPTVIYGPGYTALTDAEESTPTQAPPNNFDPLQDPGQLEVPVKTRHYLSLPAHVFWEPRGGPVRIYGGINYRYLLSATPHGYALLEGNRIVGTNNNQLSRNALSNAEERSVWSASFGTGIRLGRHLEANAFYLLPLGGHSKSEDISFNLDTQTGQETAGQKQQFQLGITWIW